MSATASTLQTLKFCDGACAAICLGLVGLAAVLLLFDGSNGLELVQRVLREKGVPTGQSVKLLAEESVDNPNWATP